MLMAALRDLQWRRRRFVIANTPEHDKRIVGVVSDGLAAVLKAEELQPDVILLDVGLPKLNGIEAARRIRRVARIRLQFRRGIRR